jgi:hypothetical protein
MRSTLTLTRAFSLRGPSPRIKHRISSAGRAARTRHSVEGRPEKILLFGDRPVPVRDLGHCWRGSTSARVATVSLLFLRGGRNAFRGQTRAHLGLC